MMMDIDDRKDGNEEIKAISFASFQAAQYFAVDVNHHCWRLLGQMTPNEANLAFIIKLQQIVIPTKPHAMEIAAQASVIIHLIKNPSRLAWVNRVRDHWLIEE